MIRLLILFTVGFLSFGCRPGAPAPDSPKPSSDVVARVGSVDITVSDFAALAAERRCPDTPEARAALLHEMIEEETLVQRARSLGLDQTSAYRQAMRRFLTARLDEQELQPLLTRAETISDADLDAACLAAAPRFASPPTRRFAWLRIDTDAAEKEAAIARLRDATEKFGSLPADPARSGFGSIAAEYSDDTDTRYQGGDLGWHKASALPAAIPPTAALLADGQLSIPCDVPGGIAIFLATGTRSGAATDPESVKAKVREELVVARRALASSNWKAGLRQALNVSLLREPPSLPSTDSVQNLTPLPPQ